MEVTDTASEKNFLARVISKASSYLLENKLVGAFFKKALFSKPAQLIKTILSPFAYLVKLPLRLLGWLGRGLKDLLGQYATKSHWKNLTSIIIQESVAATVGAFGSALVHSYRTRQTTLPSVDTVVESNVPTRHDVFAAKARQDALDYPDTSMISKWVPRTVPQNPATSYPGTR